MTCGAAGNALVIPRAKQSGVVTRKYAYSGRGEQVRRHLGSTNTCTLNDEAGRWLGDYNDSGAPIQQAIWMDDMPVGVLANGQMYYVQPDHLGTPRAVIDPVRDVAVWKWDLKGEAFGSTPPEQDADGDGASFLFDMRFPGQRHDEIAGLSYNYLRDYDAATGRYIQSDPLGLDAGVATYVYALANPLMRRDPLGLLSDSVGEYCDPMRGLPCGGKPRDNSWCGVGCKQACESRLRKDLNLANDHYGATECDPDHEYGQCEFAAAGQYWTLQVLARKRYRDCLDNCKECPC